VPFTPSDIAYFLEAARQQHFGRAAREVGISQPALTKAIRRLEAAVGVTLFERGAGGARLTADGQLFLKAARRFEAQHGELERLAGELRAQHAGLLRVGMTNPEARSLVVAALANLVRQRPGMRVSLRIDTSDLLNDAVERGDLDTALAPAYPGHPFTCTQLVVGEDRVRVAARVDHPLFSLRSPAVGDLAPYGWVMPSPQSASRRLLTQIFEAAGAPAPRAVVEAEYMSAAVLGIVAGTDLLAAVPVSVLQAWAGSVQALPLPMLEFRRTLVMLTRPEAQWSPLMEAFRDGLLAHRQPRRTARR
jgi:DNA-binding transcriptional LysR family regulator